MTRNTDNAVLNESNATNNSKIKINSIDWYKPHYPPSLEKLNRLRNQITKKTPTELLYPEKSVFMKEVNTQNFWTFELGTQEGINVPIWIYVVFQRSDRQHDQHLNNDTFYRKPVSSAQCNIGTKKHPDSGILLNYNDDDSSQAYGRITEVFKALTKDNILQTYISEDDFRSSKDADGYSIHSFGIRCQKNFESGQSVNIEFKLDGVVRAGKYVYALHLTNGLVSLSLDGQRMFDLTEI